MNAPSYNPVLHRIALFTACATFPLIFMGGLVTSHGAGLAVPDWPNSYGYNMFLFPISMWKGGIFFEHTHRLMATVVGMCSIVLVISAWKLESRSWARWLAYGILAAVIFQGLLGGLRVVLVNLDLAIVHACFAQAFFCLASFMAIVTSRWWFAAPDLSQSSAQESGGRLIRLATICVGVVYCQLIVGALMRHFAAGLAIPDFPLSYGRLLPPMTEAARMSAIQQRIADRSLIGVSSATVTFGQIWLNFAHRVGAVIVTCLLLTLIIKIWRHHREGLSKLAAALLVLLIGQITLGILTILLRKPADVASAHVAVGALTLMTTFVLLVRSMRLYSPLWRDRSQGFEVSVSESHGMVTA